MILEGEGEVCGGVAVLEIPVEVDAEFWVELLGLLGEGDTEFELSGVEEADILLVVGLDDGSEEVAVLETCDETRPVLVGVTETIAEELVVIA